LKTKTSFKIIKTEFLKAQDANLSRTLLNASKNKQIKTSNFEIFPLFIFPSPTIENRFASDHIFPSNQKIQTLISLKEASF
jgi:hypothetical protein